VSRLLKKIRLTPSLVALLLANAVVLVGVVFFEWQIYLIMLLFWSENVTIGLFTMLKMLTARPRELSVWPSKLILIPFFAVHYGIFTTVHGVFVRSLFGADDSIGRGLIAESAEMSRLVVESGLSVALLAVVLSHGFSFVWNYLATGEYREADVQEQMSRPYGRVVVLHLTIILGGFLVMILQSPLGVLAVLVVGKTILDAKMHEREHAGTASATRRLWPGRGKESAAFLGAPDRAATPPGRRSAA
jgi:hypothetical protein